MTAPNERPSAERLNQLREYSANFGPAWARELFRELDAVTRERDDLAVRLELEKRAHIGSREELMRARREIDRLEPNDITADDIIPPVSAGRVRGIAVVWLKPQAMKAEADLLALANWLDRYHAMMREVLNESDAGNG